MREKSINHPTYWLQRQHANNNHKDTAEQNTSLADVIDLSSYSYEIDQILPMTIDEQVIADHRNLLLQNNIVKDISLDQVKRNLLRASNSGAAVVLAARNGDELKATVTATQHRGGEAWVEDYLTDCSGEEKHYTAEMFEELHHWFGRAGVKQVNLVAEDDRHRELFSEIGYHQAYETVVFEKQILHTADVSSIAHDKYPDPKIFRIYEAVGKAAVQHLPSGIKSWITPPKPSRSAAQVMRKLEAWLGSKDVSVARYVGNQDNVPFEGYGLTSQQIYRYRLK